MEVKELPEGWVEVSLDRVAQWGSGGTPSRKKLEYYNGNIPWIKTGDLGEKYIKHSSEFITEDAIKNSSAKMFSKGSVALAMYGATIGKTSILDIDATTNQACAVGKPNKAISSEFLYYLLRNEKDNFIAKAKGGAQPNISQTVIKNHNIFLPSIHEQNKIVSLINRNIAQVEQIQNSLNAIPKILEKFRQSVLADAVSGKLTEGWRGDSLTNNSNWQLIRLNDIAHWGSGGTPSRKIIEYYNGDIPWVKTGDLGKKYLNKTSENITVLGLKNSSAKIYPKGVVAIAMYGATIGKVSILNIQAATNQACAVAKAKQGITNSEYIYYFLLSQKDEFIRKGKGGAQPNISQTLIKEHPINLPPLPEQTEIVRRVEELFAFADQIEERVAQAQSRVNHLTQSILNQAFTGKLTEQWRADNPELITGDNSAVALLASIESERKTTKTRKSKTAKNKTNKKA
ncbi:restriction endonuclease subunit S [Psychrobacter sp. I-STPA6b]|uniref:restriction endonuclease subunit S n=1 Tax=Psychrobacter sp. I-STPA6b TaxID=2585718 RepID=UPI001D0C283F|nr:restriction endonuclease subunit S [Psychrobacter sp. I-STPA6b]